MNRAESLTRAAMLAAALALSACAPAPLYTKVKPVPGAVTYGEIPRDAYGEPIWSAIPPQAKAPRNMPAA